MTEKNKKTKAARAILCRARAHTRAFLQKKASVPLLALLFFGCILLFQQLSGYRYLLTGSAPPFILTAIQVYAVDFSVGFISRALIGEILSWFFPVISLAQITAVARCAALAGFALQALLAAVVARKAWLRRDHIILPLLAVFVFHPLTCLQGAVMLGILDTYNLILFLLFLFYANKKLAAFLSPVFCFIGVMIHYQFTFAFFPGFFAVLLYFAVKNNKPDPLRTAGVLATMIVTLTAALYFIFSAKNNVTVSMEEFNAHLIARYKDYNVTGLLREYFDYYIFKTYKGVVYEDPFEFLGMLAKYAVDRFEPKTFAVYLYCFLPTQLLLSSVWFRFVKLSHGARRLVFLLFLIHPLLLAVTLAVSTDRFRWFANYTVTALGMLFAVYAAGEPLFADYESRLNAVLDSKPKKLLAAAAFAAHLLTCLDLVSSVIHVWR